MNDGTLYRWLDQQGEAFGAPGLEPRWTSSVKDAVGTAYSASSRVWFTCSHGILNEIYHPTIDSAQVRDMEFLRRHTDKTAKMTLPGPFTMSRQAQNEHYRDEEEMIMDFAAAVNEEARDLVAAGADVIQLDEPWVRSDPDKARRYAVQAINRALEGITVPTVVHLCFGYAAVVPGETKPSGYSFLPELAACNAECISIEAAQPKLDLGVLKDLAAKRVMLGVLDLGNGDVETAEAVAARVRAGLKYLSPRALMPAPDCGMKYLPRDVAFGKLKALAEGAAIVRRELG